MSFVFKLRESQRTWPAQIADDLLWLHRAQAGASPSFVGDYSMLKQVRAEACKSQLQARKRAALLQQATESDIAALDAFQSDAFGTVGIQVGPPAPVSEWFC